MLQCLTVKWAIVPFHLIVASLLFSCTVSSNHGGTAPVAIAVRLPHATGPAVVAQVPAAAASDWWARILTWIWESNEAVAQQATIYRLVVDVGAADLPSQVVTVPLDSLAPQTVTVRLDVPSGTARAFRITIEQQPAGQSGYTPVYAGCHTGVDLQPNTPADVSIALAETTTCLRVIVLGGGPQLDQPLPGIRVLMHENTGAVDEAFEERVTDTNGIADFGQPTLYAAPCSTSTCPTWQVAYLSFVLKQTNPSVADTVLTLKAVPVSGDIRFNVAKSPIGNLVGTNLLTSIIMTSAVRDPYPGTSGSAQQSAREVLWYTNTDYQDADALIVQYKWQIGPGLYERTEIMTPYDSPFPFNRLEALPADLDMLVPPLGTNVTVQTKIRYLAFNRVDGTLTWPNWTTSPPDYANNVSIRHEERFNRLTRPYIGSTGVFDDTLLFGQTTTDYQATCSITNSTGAC